MGGRVKVCSHSEGEAYERHERSHGVHDKDRRERVTSRRGQRELGFWCIGKQIVYIGSASAVVHGNESHVPVS
jgi:hypothetical protein